MESICNDPAKLEQFSRSPRQLHDKAAHGEANTTDVHAMFGNDAKLEAAIRNSQLVETAKKYDSSQGGARISKKVRKDSGDKLIAELQRNPTPPKETEIIKFVDLINNNAKPQAIITYAKPPILLRRSFRRTAGRSSDAAIGELHPQFNGGAYHLKPQSHEQQNYRSQAV